MALVDLTAAAFLSADGKVAGIIAVQRGPTQYIRRRYPSKNLTAAQRRNTSAFSLVDGAWRHLPRSTRDEWNAYQSWRANFGYNRFQAANIPRALANLPLYLHPSNIP